jgi:nifR3 family TIM-barrel protein
VGFRLSISIFHRYFENKPSFVGKKLLIKNSFLLYKSMRLGPLELDTNLIMAPMMDVTLPPVQEISRHYGGVGLVITPMLFVNQIHSAPKTVIPILEYLEKQRPIGIQIVASGRDPIPLKSTIDLLNSFDFDLIDINSGCPARHTCNSGGGCNLIRSIEDDRLKFIVEYCVKHSDKPVSVKTRLGWENSDKCVEIAQLIESWGPVLLTIHGRTGKQGYSGKVDYASIKSIKEALKIPVVGNGDITNHETYDLMKETGVDGMMIGRALMNNPKIFSIIHEYSKNGDIFNYSPNVALMREYLSFLDSYINSMPRFWNNPRFKSGLYRRMLIGYSKGIPNYRKIRVVLSQMKTHEEMQDFINGSEIEQIISDHSIQ